MSVIWLSIRLYWYTLYAVKLNVFIAVVVKKKGVCVKCTHVWAERSGWLRTEHAPDCGSGWDAQSCMNGSVRNESSQAVVWSSAARIHFEPCLPPYCKYCTLYKYLQLESTALGSCRNPPWLSIHATFRRAKQIRLCEIKCILY